MHYVIKNSKIFNNCVCHAPLYTFLKETKIRPSFRGRNFRGQKVSWFSRFWHFSRKFQPRHNLKSKFAKVCEGNGGTDKKGCSRCGKSRCQVCNVMSNSEHFHSNIDSREYRINYSFNCDSSNVVYLLECTVCGVQYVGSTCTPFRLRFNNYKACSRKFNSGASVPQVEFFRHFTEEGHHGFLKDISVKIIDRLTGGNRMRESFWQYRLDCFAPKGLNTRQVDT